MFKKVLIANRGAIACRIVRTLRRMGVLSVAVYSEADYGSMHVSQADEAVMIGQASAAQSYLSIPAILRAARQTGAEAIHPGYGFLSENASFAEACEAAGIVFIGPTPEQMREFGLKHRSREIATASKAPLLPGTGILRDAAEAAQAAASIGYPVMLKSTAGGGGIGMRLCRNERELEEAFEAVAHLGRANFGDAGVFLEKAILRARHIEVQIFGDGQGHVVALGERDCSAQRRNQKVLEETPAPVMTTTSRRLLWMAAERLGKAVNYRSAGTVEFIFDDDQNAFYFLEVNTRLQVEHGVTEEVTGVDLVEWMVRAAVGDVSFLHGYEARPQGASIQARIYAENPGKDFQPSSGRITEVIWPASARVETWVELGAEVTPYYDPMLAKIIVRGKDRDEAVAKLQTALAECSIAGIETNLEYLREAVRTPEFAKGMVTTALLPGLRFLRNVVEVIAPGTQTTLEDYPGRLGYWHVGVPPSGPMDYLALRIANRLVGNPEGEAALEIAVSGPSLRFLRDTVVAVTGADFGARLDGQEIAPWTAFYVRGGGVLEFGLARGAGARAYLAVAGGIDAPAYLGSRSTFILGKFGGHGGRTLRAGDVLHLREPHGRAQALSPGSAPQYSNRWQIGVLYGPHGAPDFFTDRDIDIFFSTDWKVHYNSDRTGVRLIGPKPEWARKDGGEAGLHPSNIHDNAYAIGTVDFTGDMPVILGPDGPSLGGFVCPATIVQAELWKIGQLKPGDTVRFVPLSREHAESMEVELDRFVETLAGALPSLPPAERQDPVLRQSGEWKIRADGDKYLLVEYGSNVLDFDLRFRVHALEAALRASGLRGIVDITPGVRSLHIHYDSRLLRREELLAALEECDRRAGASSSAVESRIVHLPLCWDDPQTQLAIQKYMQSVRADAPWCPSNIEFIRRINGLGSEEDVKRIVFGASYLVLGLGDVYLGAPVATPVDPRHRLVTTKYNPARTWTPENAVGIGGAYLCVYGMEGPGGYQFVGRTVQMWNTWKATPEFEPGTPWLLRFFDQIRFHPVSAQELLDARASFPHGRYPLRIETAKFDMTEYRTFLQSIEGETQRFKQARQAAFDDERERWAAAGLASYESEPAETPAPSAEDSIPAGCRPVQSPLTASVWNVVVEEGEMVQAGQKLVVLEAMKMEIVVAAPVAGVVEKILCSRGSLMMAGQNLVALNPETA
jgi:urea carboxylase